MIYVEQSYFLTFFLVMSMLSGDKIFVVQAQRVATRQCSIWIFIMSSTNCPRKFAGKGLSKRWRRLKLMVKKKPADMNLSERMTCFDECMKFRSPFHGPMTQPIQEMYDKALEALFDTQMDCDFYIAVDPCVAAKSQQVSRTNALSWALTRWLGHVTHEPMVVSVSTTFPVTFVELIQLILQGQSERVENRLAFLTSTQPLRSLV